MVIHLVIRGGSQMEVDRARLAEVLSADYTYYEGPTPQCRIDARLNPDAREIVGAQLHADMRVLDIGCGDGTTLLRLSPRFRHGVGIDNDRSHLDLAMKAQDSAGVANVEFLPLDVDDVPGHPWPEPFDFVFSERGPVGYHTRSVQAALRVLRTGGLIFSEVIGDLHHQEVREIFGDRARFNQNIRALDQVKVAMERSGVGIRVAADIVSKRYYPDVYEWLKFQCGIWAWTGHPLPLPDDPRFDLFTRRHSEAVGGIEVTHHVVWVGGVKLEDPPRYAEHQHFE
jgi:SAM-dependent methyltransferase